MKKIRNLFTIFILSTLITSIFAVPAFADSELSEVEIENDDIEKPVSGDTLTFVLRARWGYVRGNTEVEMMDDDTASTTDSFITKNYDGSIYANDITRARISLIEEDHFEGNDAITNEKNPVSWESRIRGHWDGVEVLITAKEDEEITVQVPNGSITKTARNWYLLTGHALENLGDDQYLDVQTNKKDNRRYATIIMWGKKDQGVFECITTPCEQESIDFSGSLQMVEGSFVKLLKELRFEKGDKIEDKDRNKIEWTSTITTGRDGIYTLLIPDRSIDLDSGFSITFPNINNGWTKNYSFEDVRLGSRETVEVNGQEYVVIVGQKTLANRLVRSKKDGSLYLIENNTKRKVPNSVILKENGLDDDEVFDIDEDELETLADGPELSYPNGTVIVEGDKRYVIADGIKRLIANAKSEKAFSGVRSFITNLADRLTNKLLDGEPIESEDGVAGETLVKVPGHSAVWLVSGNKKKYFHRAKVFEEYNYDWNKIKTITQEKLDEFDFSGVVTYPDGTLVKIREIPKVFLIENGELRWIETEEEFKHLGLKFSDVIDIAFEELQLYSEGEPVVSE